MKTGAAGAGGNAYPAGSLNVNGFSFFNAVSFQIILGAPVILFAKSLGASSIVLGVVAALTPLLTVLQLVAARFLHRVGYRRFILAGWGTRTLFTLAVAVLPLAPGLSPSMRLALLIVCLFGFNFLRGLASGAWLPWLTALIPENVRGRFLSRDQAFMHLGCLTALLASAAVIGKQARPAEYAAVFGLGVLAALASLWFIRRVPDCDSPEELRRSAVRVPWGAMLAHPPFARLLAFSVLYMVVTGSLGVFTVEYLVVREKFPESTILLLSSLAFGGALTGLAMAGPAIDRSGSKPWLGRALGLQAAVIAGWWLLAGGVAPAWPVMIGGLNFLGGLGGALFGLANTRIIMGSFPHMGRNHFFALFTVVTSMGLGGAPVAWGAMLDTLGTMDEAVGGISINRYSVYFLALFVLALVARAFVGSLHEGAREREAFERALAAQMREKGFAE